MTVSLPNTASGPVRIAACCVLLAAPAANAALADFSTWTLVEDPAHGGLTGVVNSASRATLSASGPIPNAYDIGYQSVNGDAVSNSSSGYFFSASEDFSIAIDFSLAFGGSLREGAGGIGFGVGEDGSGVNSAGVALVFADGAPFAVTGVSRVNDVTQSPQLLGMAAVPDSGRFFIDYDSLTGDVGFGVSATPGSAAPDVSGTLAGVQDLWGNDPLLVSFFLRSEALDFPPILTVPPLSAGTVDAVFSDFTVLTGAPQSATVPLPAAFWLMGSALLGFGAVRRRRADQPPH